MSKVRTRFAPSPTGNLHIGGVRTALFSWLYAQKYKGEFILRIEDTDTERSTQASTDAILENLNWLGITPSKSPIYQSHRLNDYKKIAERLVASGHAYYCNCDQERLDRLRTEQKSKNLKFQYDRKCRELNLSPEKHKNCVIRLKTPLEGEVSFEDEVYGLNVVQNKELDDLIIIRSDGSPVYNFAVVLDDIDNQITHVIRGDDHLNNTSRQIHLYSALGESIPKFAHCPMVLGNDGKRLSKRHGATDVGSYREQGFLPISVLNYLIRLGWSYGDQELFTIEEMVEFFDLKGINRASPQFDSDKFLWVNQQQLRIAPEKQSIIGYQEQLEKLKLKNIYQLDIKKVIELYCERYATLKQIAEESDFLFQEVEWQEGKELYKEHIAPNLDTLSLIQNTLVEISDEHWQTDIIMQKLKDIAKSNNLKMFQVGMPFRVALSGKKNTPDISHIATHLGKQETLLRLSKVLELTIES